MRGKCWERCRAALRNEAELRTAAQNHKEYFQGPITFCTLSFIKWASSPVLHWPDAFRS